MSLKDFELGKELGEGAFGSVKIVKRKLDNQVYAMKTVKIASLDQKDRENALNEIRLLYALNHPNVIGYKEAFYDEASKTINIVMEFADGGDIASKIRKLKEHHERFQENTIWSCLIQILEGMSFLHKNKVIHRDLKCANIFLTKKGEVKIGDLNVSKLSKQQFLKTQTGTPYYISPEIWLDKPYNEKADIWSIGCVIYEMCTGNPPFTGTNFRNLSLNILNGKYNPISSSIYSKDLSDVIALMLKKDPNDRPSCEILLNNAIIKKRINCIDIFLPSKVEPKGQVDMIKTIKIPRNLKDLNKALPKKKYKNRIEQEMMEHDEFESTKKMGLNKLKEFADKVNIKLPNQKNSNQSNDNNHLHFKPAIKNPILVHSSGSKNSKNEQNSNRRGPNANPIVNYNEMIKVNENALAKNRPLSSNENLSEQQKALVRKKRAQDYINNMKNIVKNNKPSSKLLRPPSAFNKAPIVIKNKILPKGSHKCEKEPIIVTKSNGTDSTRESISNKRPQSGKVIIRKNISKNIIGVDDKKKKKVIIQKVDYKPSSNKSNKKVYVFPSSAKNKSSEAGKGFHRPVYHK